MTHEEKICYKTWRMKVKICMICSPLSSGRHAVHCEFHHSGLYCTQSPRLRAQKSQTTFLVDKTCYSSLAQTIWRTSVFWQTKRTVGCKRKKCFINLRNHEFENFFVYGRTQVCGKINICHQHELRMLKHESWPYVQMRCQCHKFSYSISDLTVKNLKYFN